jgi:hypothetical protein
VENNMMISRKGLWTRHWKLIEGRNEYLFPTCDDKGVFTDDETHTGNTSKYGG